MTEKKKEVQCEIKDTMLALQRFLATNNKKVVFVGGMVAFDDDGKVKKDTGALFGFGHIDDIRHLLFDLSNIVEDSVNEEGFVNI